MNILNKTIQNLIDDGVLSLSQVNDLVKKNERAEVRKARSVRRSEVKSTVFAKIDELLSTTPDAAVKHRQVWEAVGRDAHTRDEVLSALRSLRDDGVLQNIRKSGNNFQVFWALEAQAETPVFGTVADIREA